jgi:hypothetical protein
MQDSHAYSAVAVNRFNCSLAASSLPRKADLQQRRNSLAADYLAPNRQLFETVCRQQTNLRDAVEQGQIAVAKAMAIWVGAC